MKLHLSTEVNVDELDASASSPAVRDAFIRKVCNQFYEAARHAIETRMTQASDRGVLPSNVKANSSGFHFQPDEGIQT